FASNTSALRITNMASVTKRPEKVVGMHFFNPPMLMPLVEVIRADTTSEATLTAAVDLAKSLGKTVVVVKKDVPGFITTRVLGPYFEEAAWIHDAEGIAIETIDAAMRFRAGFPMGPFELADQVGIDVLHHLIKNANRPVPRSVQTVIDGKKFGRKADEGYYSYKGGRPALRPDMWSGFDPIRILAPMINEAAELVALDVANPPRSTRRCASAPRFPMDLWRWPTSWALTRCCRPSAITPGRSPPRSYPRWWRVGTSEPSPGRDSTNTEGSAR